MAIWSFVNKGGNYDLHYVSPQQPEGRKVLTKTPQPLDCVMYWVLEPEQAGYCDVIEMNGRRWGVMDWGTG